MMKTSAAQFAATAGEVFAPLYPIVARRIRQETGMTRGRCLDLGTGTGLLGLAMARATDLEVLLFDVDPEMLVFARDNVEASGLSPRVRVVQGDVHQLPFPDASVDLVVSRGSIFFWQEPAGAFREVRRVLTPDGRAWMGGGFGTGELKQKITAEMKRRDPDWEPQARERTSPSRIQGFRLALKEAGIADFTMENDDRGFWIHFGKDDRMRSCS